MKQQAVTLTPYQVRLVRGALMRALDWTEMSIQGSEGRLRLSEKRVYKRYHTLPHKTLASRGSDAAPRAEKET